MQTFDTWEIVTGAYEKRVIRKDGLVFQCRLHDGSFLLGHVLAAKFRVFQAPLVSTICRASSQVKSIEEAEEIISSYGPDETLVPPMVIHPNFFTRWGMVERIGIMKPDFDRDEYLYVSGPTFYDPQHRAFVPYDWSTRPYTPLTYAGRYDGWSITDYDRNKVDDFEESSIAGIISSSIHFAGAYDLIVARSLAYADGRELPKWEKTHADE